ncbi:hypothetical protein ASG46_13865 [Bacillus sp. Leaf49]|uniref:hypothetical protein n=1 Tax=Bacillus altitudinis TaxID=293387 RepID=UPI000300468B|nr:hypothetical protein [Bacillus altitudinis]KOA80800.1 hypothetical protein ACR53_05510 [Bacillus stratosphericus]KQU09377.1 hypothetical protein ASG46_13865 [Bacillus sp. Leaf49]QKL22669.1 hypothetical protein RI02_13515 [Bacillus altitudinis]QKL26402.1 hypothetical protein EQK04_13515 [Bacillus altitudinis]QXY96782.1 hypothetical protein G4D59_13375 [Bacillus altitudinis]
MKMSAEHVMGKSVGWKTSGAFLLSTVSGQASVTPRSFISDILTIQLPEGNDQNRMYATL